MKLASSFFLLVALAAVPNVEAARTRVAVHAREQKASSTRLSAAPPRTPGTSKRGTGAATGRRAAPESARALQTSLPTVRSVFVPVRWSFGKSPVGDLAEGRRSRVVQHTLHQPTQEQREILDRLGITGKNANVPQEQWDRDPTEEPVHLGLAGTIKALKRHPYLTRTILFSEKERHSTAKFTIEQYYSPIKDPKIRLSDEVIYQKRIKGLYNRLGNRLEREMGIPRLTFGGRIAVVEGGEADSFNAVTLRNGSIILHRQLIDVADTVGQAVAASHSRNELIDNVAKVAEGTFQTPAGQDPKLVRRYSDSFLALVIGHEMTHGMKFHSAIGEPHDPGIPQWGIGSREGRARETVSDGGGAELVARGSFSPLGAAAVPLFFTMIDAHAGELGNSGGSHPAGFDRYRFTYNYLDKRQDRQRFLYDGLHDRIAGLNYMSKAMKAEFAMLPTPEEVRVRAQAIIDNGTASPLAQPAPPLKETRPAQAPQIRVQPMRRPAPSTPTAAAERQGTSCVALG